MTCNKGSDLRKEALQDVEKCVCQDRNVTYGDAEDSFSVIASFWGAYLKNRAAGDITSHDVAAMMVLFKVARLAKNPQHRDSWIDAGGYAICGAGLRRRRPRRPTLPKTKTTTT